MEMGAKGKVAVAGSLSTSHITPHKYLSLTLACVPRLRNGCQNAFPSNFPSYIAVISKQGSMFFLREYVVCT